MKVKVRAGNSTRRTAPPDTSSSATSLLVCGALVLQENSGQLVAFIECLGGGICIILHLERCYLHLWWYYCLLSNQTMNYGGQTTTKFYPYGPIENVASIISVCPVEEGSGYDHGGCIKLLYNRISSSETQKVIWLKMKPTNQNTSASEYRLCWWTRVQMKRRPTIITVHLPAPAASLSAGGPRSRWKTILTCIHINNSYKYNNSKLKRKWENEKSSI